MRRIIPLLTILALGACVYPFQSEDNVFLPRTFLGLRLGESLRSVQKQLGATSQWPGTMELSGRLVRMEVNGSLAKALPEHVEAMRLSFTGEESGVFEEERLTEMQFIYDAKYSRERPADAMASDLALAYGDAHRSPRGRYWWHDAKTVWLVYFEPVPLKGQNGEKVVELRTSLQIADADLFSVPQ